MVRNGYTLHMPLTTDAQVTSTARPHIWLHPPARSTQVASTCRFHLVIGGQMTMKHRPAHALVVGRRESNTFEVFWQTAKGCDLFRIETPGAIRILGSIAQGTRPQFQLARPVTFWQTAKRCGPRPTPQLNKPNRLPSDTRRTRGDQHLAWYT